MPASSRRAARPASPGMLARRIALLALFEDEFQPGHAEPALDRLERAILRSALFEMLYSAATPSGEPMRDAVSLARIYAGDAARRLVNGVLGSVSRSSGRGAQP